MTDFLFKSAIVMAVLLALYHLLLEREKMHRFNRFYLLGALAVSFITPFITIPIYVEATAAPTTTMQVAHGSAVASTHIPETNYWLYAVGTIYAVVTAAFLIRFIINLDSFRRKIKAGTTANYQDAKLVLLAEETLPHTFLNYIFVNRQEYEDGKIETELYTHELVHVNQMHTIDILFIELLKIAFWFNPLLYLCKKAIQLNHEFLADQGVIETTEDTYQYQTLLLDKVSFCTTYNLASNLNFSLTKKRFAMMTKTTNKSKAIILQLLSIPMITALVFLMCTETIAQVNPAQKKNTSSAAEKTLSPKERRDAYYSGVHVLIDDKVNNRIIDKPYEQLTEDEKDRYAFYAPEPDGKGTNSHYPGTVFKMTLTAEYQNDKIITKRSNVPIVPNTTDSKVSEDVVKFGELDTQPKFIEGGFQAYVVKNMTIPEIKENITARIYVSFIVEIDGTVTNVKIVRDAGHGLGDEIKRVIEGSPKWMPGTKDGKPQRTSYTLPITIRIQN